MSHPVDSAILLLIEIPAPLSCSANLNRFLSVNVSAISRSLSNASIDFCQTFNVSNLNLCCSLCSTLYALCS
ncbi:MAG: hypothetical protein QME16_06080, partial [Planctomycetota bacterium]|nr:hypothetical protein [Planctomycetota bacterium]